MKHVVQNTVNVVSQVAVVVEVVLSILLLLLSRIIRLPLAGQIRIVGLCRNMKAAAGCARPWGMRSLGRSRA